jgi:hypothetical protein
MTDELESALLKLAAIKEELEKWKRAGWNEQRDRVFAEMQIEKLETQLNWFLRGRQIPDAKELGEIVYLASYPGSSVTYNESCSYEKEHCERIGTAVRDAVIRAMTD